MITTKQYDKALGKCAEELRVYLDDSMNHGQDYKITTDRVIDATRRMYELSLKLQGQEEGNRLAAL